MRYHQATFLASLRSLISFPFYNATAFYCFCRPPRIAFLAEDLTKDDASLGAVVLLHARSQHAMQD